MRVMQSLALLCLIVVASVSLVSAGLHDSAKKTGRYMGTCVPIGRLNDAANMKIVKEEFGVITCENEMKLDATEPSKGTFQFGNADKIMDWAVSNGKTMRGHTLAWHSQQPSWMQSMSGASLRTAMIDHIKGVLGHYKGNKNIIAWDVVNEAFDDSNGGRRSSNLQNTGNDWIEVAFKTAHDVDPAAKLCYNDYNTDHQEWAKAKGVFALMKDFTSRKIPVHCIGFQSHINGQSTLPNDFQANLQQYADLGLDVQITELDIEGASSATYGNAIKACSNVKRCQGVTIWGVRDPDSWRASGSPLIFDGSGNKKPAYTGVLNALDAATIQFESAFSSNSTPPVEANACKTSNGGCDARGTCTLVAGATSCACPNGYTLAADKKACTAVVAANACLTSNGGCDATRGICTVVAGAASCACPNGFTINSATKACTANPVNGNACKTSNGGCDATNGLCTLTAAGAAQCDCKDGYTLAANQKTCTADDPDIPAVNVCKTNNGGCDKTNGRCTVTGGKAVCSCKTAGYTLDENDKVTCNKDEEEPTPSETGCFETANACRNGGTCTPQGDVGVCECKPNFIGATCNKCETGYRLTAGACVLINDNAAVSTDSDSATTTVLIIVLIIVVLAIVGLLAYKYVVQPRAAYQTNSDKMGGQMTGQTNYYSQQQPPPPAPQGYPTNYRV